MKPIVREYLAALRERDELDAILPELLSALGYTVYSRPSIGTRQYGVDIAALSPSDEAGARRVCLFSVKKGDLTRQEWSGGSAQALRPSLDEIIDAYIPSRIPPEYKGYKVTICLCFGGDVVEGIRQEVTGYTNRHSTQTLSFEEWNGDRIAGYLVDGVLSDDLVPENARTHLRKAIALLDEPDAAYGHFRRLADVLVLKGRGDVRARALSLRQIYLGTWVTFVWARDAGNLEAAYRIGELALLSSWELAKADIVDGSRQAAIEAIRRTFEGILGLYLIISRTFVEKFAPFVTLPDALSLSIGSQSSLDVNLKLFDLLGRFALYGIWNDWMLQHIAAARAKGSIEEARDVDVTDTTRLSTEAMLSLVANNPALGLPMADHGATDIALALFCWVESGLGAEDITPWLQDMVGRLDYTVRTRRGNPTTGHAYQDLMAEHADRSDDGFKAATAGSTLVPMLAVWTTAIGRLDLTALLSEIVSTELQHCNLQLWSPGQDSEAHIYLNDAVHGRALSGLRVEATGKPLIEALEGMVGENPPFKSLSASATGYFPIVLVACRHWRLPVPPDLYITAAARSVAAREATAPDAKARQIQPKPTSSQRDLPAGSLSGGDEP